jgi:hypothetical protein
MAKTSKTPADDWLAGYIRNHVLDTLAPSERMQFRMACGRGAASVAEWADATLPKYTQVWRRLKSAQRQRRFRSVPSAEKWMADWRIAERTLGKDLTAILRRNRTALGEPAKTTPAELLRAALTALDSHLAESRGRGVVFVDDGALPPRSAETTRDGHAKSTDPMTAKR